MMSAKNVQLWGHEMMSDAPSEIPVASDDIQIRNLHFSIASTVSPTNPQNESKYHLVAEYVVGEDHSSADEFCSVGPSAAILAVVEVCRGIIVSATRNVKLRFHLVRKVVLTIICASVKETALPITCVFVGVISRELYPPLTWRPLLLYRYFQVRPTVRVAAVRDSGFGDGCTPTRKRTGESKKQYVQRRVATVKHAGSVHAANAVSHCGTLVQWRDRSVGQRNEMVSFHKRYTPAHPSRPVRIRRFPHRNSDIVGQVEFSDVVFAIGVETDPSNGEEYIVLKGGGFCRIRGTGGMFLQEQMLEACEVFPSPRYYTSARDDRSVRIRSEPTFDSSELGVLDPNEVKEAAALHTARCGTIWVQWASAGYSCFSQPHDQYLVLIMPHPAVLRCTALRPPRNMSPDVRSLSNEGITKEPIDDDDGEMPLPKQRRHERPSGVRDNGVSPSLIPVDVREKIKSGKVHLSDLPKVTLAHEEDEEGSGEEEDSDGDS